MKRIRTIARQPKNYKPFLWIMVFAFIGVAVVALSRAAPPPLLIDSTLPTPQNVRAFPDDRNTVVTWDEVTSNRVVGYYITYRVAGSSEEFKVRQTLHDQIQLQPLANGTQYEIYVQSASGTVQQTQVGNLVYGGGNNNWARGDGRVSSRSGVVMATPSSARVDAMRQRLTGFFDDFNQPAGAMDELKWNQATTACVARNTAAAFINDQFHAHNMIRSECDRAGMATRPRAVFDTSAATESNPAQIEFDMDGATHGRDVWYLDIIPTNSRSNNFPLDITSHNDALDGDNEDPGNMIRVRQAESGKIEVNFYTKNRNEEFTPYDGQNHITLNQRCPSWNASPWLTYCDMNNKTPGLSPILQSNKGTIVPNVRKHWVVQLTPTKIRLFVDSVFLGEGDLPPDFAAEKRHTVHSTVFSYNTGKDSQYEGATQITPYVQLLHWDNFGFTGPAPTEVVHNYLEGGSTGIEPVYSVGSLGYSIPQGPRSTIIPIPDQIGTLRNGQGRLYMTLSNFGSNSYTWNPNDHIIFNGTRYPVPNPATIINNPKAIGSCTQFVASITPFSFAIPINASDIRQGNNNIQMNLNGQTNTCAPSSADVFNVHLELPYTAGSPNIPSYTQPLGVFGTKFLNVIQPAITNCDHYRYIEQDLGLPYQSGKSNLSIGPCALLAAASSQHGSGTGTPPPPTSDSTPPTISLSAPANSTQVTGSSVGASVDASDNTGVTRVDFYLNNVLVTTDTTSPYTATLSTTGLAAGTYPIYARAFDAANNSSQSAVSNIIIASTAPPPDTTPPTVSLTAPTSSQTVSGTFTVSANANDTQGSIAAVRYYLDGSATPFSTDTTAPFTTSWNTTSVSNGQHSILVRATDSAGNIGSSSSVSFNVNNVVADTTPPSVSISSPANNATVSGNVIVSVTAADNVGVSRVELIVDGVSRSTDSTSPFSFTWATTGISNGPHTMYARAFDAANNMSTSTPQLTLSVNNTVTPPAPTPKPGDVNGDNLVNSRDASVLLINWNRTGTTRAQGDLNGDGVVNVRDASLLLANWGR